MSFVALGTAEESPFSIELSGATTCCVLSFDLCVFMCGKPGLAVDRLWSLSCYWPR